MSFHTADYETYVVLGDPNADPIWNWKEWKEFLPAINPLIELSRGKPAVRSNQYLPNRAGVVKFGRLGWKEPDHQKWCHCSPVNLLDSKAWSFLSVEAWAPSWNICERDNLAPDVYICVMNQSLSGMDQSLLFNPLIVFAVASSFAREHISKVNSVVSALRELTKANLVGYQCRPWGITTGPTSFTNSIQDLAVTGLFVPGQRHQGKIGFHLFLEKWEPATQR